ncbi:hypothetical protein OJF2_35950 [Aquisphaera giovannonii]|uniref:Uncharacterized protein n=1 Tax=Aquisphaera giovannonii TaxID=406548 RepID=A0A5B9W4V4_9BACT|nr:hypothetical protein OJF2_35950 [Aquisphaera giovannonii]
MSAKHSEVALPASSERIREAKAALKRIPKERKLELMVEAGAITPEQADRARKRLADRQE